MFGLIACVGLPISTVKAGPVDAAGNVKVSCARSTAVGKIVLVALIVTDAGDGYAVVYNPVLEIVPTEPV
jgi:hypothetical protein